MTEFVADNRTTFESPGQYARTAGNIAQFLLGIDWFLRFAEDSGCIHFGEAKRFRESVTASLLSLSAEQANYRPGGPSEVDNFRKLLRLVFHLKVAHTRSANSLYIRNPYRCGWDCSTFESHKDKPHGTHIGWVGGKDALGERTDMTSTYFPT